MTELLSGKYVFREGSFEADPGLEEILRRLGTMRLLHDMGDGRPSFYVDNEGCYWELREYEDQRSELERVDAHHIQTNHPTVDLARTP